jgi:hypothetical protein
MRQTARLRLAVYLAAAFTTAAMGSLAADEKGPTRPETTVPQSELTTERVRRRDTYPFRGIIATIDINARTLLLEGRQTRRLIRVLESTRFEKEGKPAMLGDLKPGERVAGTLRKNASGAEEALLIRGLPAPLRNGEPPPAPAEEAPEPGRGQAGEP